MTDAEKIATIEVLLLDLEKLRLHIGHCSRGQDSINEASILAAEAAAITQVARVVGVELSRIA